MKYSPQILKNKNLFKRLKYPSPKALNSKYFLMLTGPILESKGMYATSQKKGKKGLKKAKYFKIWAKMYKI